MIRNGNVFNESDDDKVVEKHASSVMKDEILNLLEENNNLSSTVPIKSDEHHISLAEKDDDGDVIGAIFRFDSD